MMRAQIEEWWENVWTLRARVSAAWPTPSVVESLAYAVTEIAEAINADLRAKNPKHVRNNFKVESVGDELADTVIMLLTATRKTLDSPVSYAPLLRLTLLTLNAKIAELAVAAERFSLEYPTVHEGLDNLVIVRATWCLYDIALYAQVKQINLNDCVARRIAYYGDKYAPSNGSPYALRYSHILE